METKAQLAAAARAYEKRINGSLPIGSISIASEGDVEALVLSLTFEGELFPRLRFTWPKGKLQASRASLITDCVSDAMYSWLLFHIGFQDELTLEQELGV